jgi:hypothetical protein
MASDFVSSIGVRMLAGGLMTIHRSRINEEPHIFTEKLFNNTSSQSNTRLSRNQLIYWEYSVAVNRDI